MLDQKVPLVPAIGGDEGVQDELVERVVDLRDPRQGRGSAVGGEHLAERGDGVSGRRSVEPSMARTSRLHQRRTGASWYQRRTRWRFSSMNALGLSFWRAAQNALLVTARSATSVP